MISEEKRADITAVGIMSGTSLDGLDLACCRFLYQSGSWHYHILAAETRPYPDEWLKTLQHLPEAPAASLAREHVRYGKWTGQACREFIRRHHLNPHLIAGHGHTIFHRPDEAYTLQLGSGAAIAAETGIATIVDFRSADVALGGQGAPLVPVGDRLLFGDYAACINIGGFANFSFESDGHRKAWDICPANFILNREARKLGFTMDESGSLARNSQPDQKLLNRLNNLDYYKTEGPKSLGREWVEQVFLPIHGPESLPPAVVLSTYTAHIAFRISEELKKAAAGRVLVTGGGAHNTFLIERIRALSDATLVIPDKLTIDFKEALIFAFLGVLRLRNEVNCLADVTGASRDNCGGAIYRP